LDATVAGFALHSTHVKKRTKPMVSQEKTLADAFYETLKDVFYAEKQSVKALKKSAKAAKSPKLREAFETHAEESAHQVERLTEVFEIIGKPARAKTCEAMQGLTAEMEEDLEEFGATEAADAVLIGCAQAIEHYEIARYGVLQAWARKLGLSEVETLLGETLQEEKRADQLLSQIADQAEAGDPKRASRDEVTSPAKVPSRSKSAPDSASRDTTRA
jgi:ferritin-like metal-binding protein YciE